MQSFVNDLQLQLSQLEINDTTMTNFAYDSFEQVLQNVLDKHAPATTRVRTVRPLSPWYNDEIKEARRIRRRLERKWQKHDTDENKKVYKEKHVTVNRLIQKAKECYYNEQLAAADNKRVFEIVNKLLNNGTKFNSTIM